MAIDYFAQQFGEDEFENTTPAISDAELLAFIQANVNNPAIIANAARNFKLSFLDLARITGYSVAQISSYFSDAGIAFADAGQTATPTPPAAVNTPTPPATVNTPTSIDDIISPPTTQDDFLNTISTPVTPTTPVAPVTPTTPVAPVTPTTAAPMDKTAAVEKITQQILAQGMTGKWKGEGKGSAEANARDMARIMADTGITDIKQFGKVTKTVDAAVQPVYAQGDLMVDNEGQQFYSQKIVGYVDQDGKPVDPSLVRSEFVPGGESGNDQTVYIAPVGKQEVFGNKLTGQEVANTYSERQIGNAFGGTFEGEGNTGYRVQFDASGNPIFYTTQATSNDLAILMQDLGPIGQIGLALATGGLSIPQQIAAQMAVSVLSGKDIGDAIKSAAISFAGTQIPGMDFMKDGASFIKDLGLSPDLTKTLTNSFQNAAVSAGTALLSGQDVGEAMTRGFVTGGVNGAVNSLLGNVEGFKDLTANQKKMVTNAVTGVISGKPLDQIAINTAIAAANSAIADARKTTTTGSTTGTDTSADITTLSDEDLAELNTNELEAYRNGGVQGLANYRRSVKAGTTTSSLPSGVQLASTGNGVFKTEVGGVPTYAESSNASTVKAPLGYTLLSMSESDDKPEGSYYDITANAWFKPDTTVTNLTGSTTITSDADLFNNSLGTLDQLDTTRTGDDFADFLASIGITNTTQLTDSGLSNQDILDMINALDDTVTVTGTNTAGTITDTTGLDTGPVIPNGDGSCPTGFYKDSTGKCVPIETVKVDDKKCPPGSVYDEDLKQCVPIETVTVVAPPVVTPPVVTSPVVTPPVVPPEIVIVDKKCPPGQVYDEAQKKCVPIVTPPVVTPPVVKPPVVTPPVVKPPVVTPPVVTPPTITPTITPAISNTAASTETTNPIYAGPMSNFNLFATLEELLGNDTGKKNNKNFKDKTKMATGGHLDDLLAEQITVDDLLKLLR